MDLSTFVNWGTVLIWTVSSALWVVKAARGSVPLPVSVSSRISANNLLGLLISVGLVGSCVQSYFSYRIRHHGALEDLTIIASPPAGVTQNLQVIANQTFESQTVRLDGLAFDHVVFANSCLQYDGGPYQLLHVTFKDGWRLCTTSVPMDNYSKLEQALLMTYPSYKRVNKSVLSQH